LKRILILSRKNLFLIRWALSSAIQMHAEYLMHADWDVDLPKGSRRKVLLTSKSLKAALDALDKAWKSSDKRYLN
jgi:hypothetical protein